MRNCKNLLDLPLEVLDHIFKQLSPSNKLKFADSHPRLADAFVYHVRDLYKTVELGKEPPEDWSLILRLCGPGILGIDTWCYLHIRIQTFELIQRHCTNLEFLKARVDRKNIFAIASLMRKSGCLKSIHLSFQDYHLIDLLDIEYIIRVLIQLRPLRNLAMEVVPDSKIHLIKHFVNLEELDLSGGIYRLNVLQDCAPLKNLRSLRMSSCNVTRLFPSDTLQFQGLEKLTVYRCNIYDEFPFFPMLKSITIKKCAEWHYQDHEAWLSKHGNTLQEVVLQVDYFSERKMLSLLRNCRKLRYLFVQPTVFYTISKKSMSLFVDLLKENGFTPDRPFELTVVGNTHYWDNDQALLKAAKVFEEEPNSDLLRCTSYIAPRPFLF
ncbi:uncharacterized protein LOC108028203 [Drosophila biarmipes]|uniref:uncharacterized protein LOC108028203 n=1 Tax=Drosophila biarmipes TaxID=125945 RepID=UPI0007E7E88F|nr:uncharacterized protein LOC108028203 [Drosophila biarmipes]